MQSGRSSVLPQKRQHSSPTQHDTSQQLSIRVRNNDFDVENVTHNTSRAPPPPSPPILHLRVRKMKLLSELNFLKTLKKSINCFRKINFLGKKILPLQFPNQNPVLRQTLPSKNLRQSLFLSLIYWWTLSISFKIRWQKKIILLKIL